MEFKLTKEYELGGIVDLVESDSYLILRGQRQIYFVCKTTLELIKTIELVVDNEFGYHTIRAKDDICFIIVHSESNPDKNKSVRGNPKKAVLKAYDKDGLLWTHPMKKWSIHNNYGGVFLVEDCVIFNDIENDENYSYALDYRTGELVDKLLLEERIMNTSVYPQWGQFSVGLSGGVLFSVNQEFIFHVELTSRKLKIKPFVELEPQEMVQNENYILLYGWHEDKKLILIDKRTGKIINTIVLNDKSKIRTLTLSQDGNTVVYSLKDTDDLCCLDLNTSEKKWVLKDQGEVVQIIIGEDDDVYLYMECDEPYIDVLDLSDGSNLMKIKKQKDGLDYPFFYYRKSLFVREYHTLYCYQKES